MLLSWLLMRLLERLRAVNHVAFRRASADFRLMSVGGQRCRVLHVALVVERWSQRARRRFAGRRLGIARRRFENRLGIGETDCARADQTQQTSLLLLMVHVKIGRAVA